MKWFRCLILLVVAAARWATPASGQFVAMSIEDMTRKAEAVVHAKVLKKTSLIDSNGRLYTRVELRVLEAWKGEVETQPLVVVHGGGTVGQRTALVSGQVDYQVGEEVVAFLVFNTQGQGVTLGLAQGKFHVWQETGSSTKLARNPFHGNTEAPSQAAEQRPEAKPERLTLGSLEQQVKSAKQ